MDTDTIPWKVCLRCCWGILDERSREIARRTQAGRRRQPAEVKAAGRLKLADHLAGEAGRIAKLAEDAGGSGLEPYTLGLLVAWIAGHDEALTLLVDVHDAPGMEALAEFLSNVGATDYFAAIKRLMGR